MQIKVLSSLEKCFADQGIGDKEALETASALKNELYSFQLALHNEGAQNASVFVKAESDISDYITIRRVRQVPVSNACYNISDPNYLRKGPGLYPDLLEPFDIKNYVCVAAGATESFWFTAQNLPVGTHGISFSVQTSAGEVLAKAALSLEVIDAELPEQQMILTNWFHCDCLATYYNVEVFSERHWQIIENFVKNYVKNGLNMILTPVITPELDTQVGKERPTVQLVDIKCTNGRYFYGYAKLDRWIKMCLDCGIKYFEISHLFSQWGAKCAPKVMATVDGEYKRIFGWETASTSEEYKKFLKSFLKSLLKHLQQLGVDKKCYFHISDEPHGDEALKMYRECRKIVKNILKDYVIMDALSDFSFYKKGIVSTPIPSNDSIEPFIKANIPNLWTYYCCAQHTDVSNQFIAMPSYRNRIIGEQFYKYNIHGFLQWGYNFYYSQVSRYAVNPFVVTDADGAFPGGDPFKVYPACDGTPWDSIRGVVFNEALQDLRAMMLLEKLDGRDKVMYLMEDGLSQPITFSKYPNDAKYILTLRKRINNAIKERI